MIFKEGVFALPTNCGVDGCRSKSFTLMKKTAESIDWQKIRIQVNLALGTLSQHYLPQLQSTTTFSIHCPRQWAYGWLLVESCKGAKSF